MSFLNMNNRNLTVEQQRLLAMNINQYEQISNHIDLLYDMLNEIRGNIINISQTRNIRTNRNNNNNTNRTNQNLNNRYNFINYDSYSYYNQMNTNRNRTNNGYEFMQNNELTSLLSNFLNTSVVVRPTPEQIQNASIVIRYGDIENPLAEYCPISLDEFNDDDQVSQIIHCGHIFHQNQFQQWFENNTRCPICRYDIRNYNSSSNTNNSNTNSNSEQPSGRNNQRTEQTIPPTGDTSLTPPISNINLLRDPISNQIEQFSFDINDSQFTNSFLDQIARNILLQAINPRTNNNNTSNSSDRFMIDPSNNILFYETIIRPNRNQS